MLTTGSYQRLPTTLKQTYVGEEKPARAEIAAALEKLDDVMRMRLLCDELVPPGMKYTIAKGKAKFVVPKEFEVNGQDLSLSKSRKVRKRFQWELTRFSPFMWIGHANDLRTWITRGYSMAYCWTEVAREARWRIFPR